jgi:hypothetical protein
MTMTPTEVARRYGETWNGRDADALVAASREAAYYAIPTHIRELVEKPLVHL